MKNTRLTLFSLVTVLVLTACSVSESSDKNESKKPDSGNQNLILIDPTDTSQLSENCKKYVDDMRAQEEANGEENKYMMDGYLFRPTDTVKIDAKEGGEWVYRDAVDYTDETKRVEQQSQKSDKSKGVPLQFSLAEGFSAESYEIEVSMDEDFADKIVVDAAPYTEVRVKNLLQNTKYYWRVIADGEASEAKTFTTGDYPRWIDAADLFNVRDVGGYMTSSGKRVKQNLIFRGGEIATKAYTIGSTMSGTKHQITGTDEAKDIFRNVMKIGNQLDLRRSGDLSADSWYANKKCYFAENDDIAWTNVEIGSWESFLDNKSNIQKCFEAFAYADEAPVYYHCHGGADRTGTLGLFLMGVLGVSYSDVVIDYELTSYSSIIAPSTTSASDSLRRHYARGSYDRWNEFVPNYLEKTTGWDKTRPLADNLERYLVDVAGVPQANIDRLRDIMLED